MSSANLVQRSGLAAMLGGLLWTLFPLATVFFSIEDTRPGTLDHLATAAVYWLMAVIPLALLLLGLVGLRALQGGAYGSLGKAGFLVSFTALVLMLVGNGAEVASLTFSGSESAVGHTFFLAGFLLSLIGSVLVGIAVIRARRGTSWRAGGLLLVAALPVGILLLIVGGAVSPHTDLGFWAALTVPYGVAWIFLGYGLRAGDHESAGQPARVV